jgi:hypothetical protein
VDLDNMEIVNFKVFGEKVAATIPRRQYTSAFSRITPLLTTSWRSIQSGSWTTPSPCALDGCRERSLLQNYPRRHADVAPTYRL